MATAPSPPILIWQPGGGFPGGPVSNPPVYSQAGITPLIIGQNYVDVVFGSIQTTSDWVLVECDVTNTADLAPLNIWTGLVTNRTTTGFRVWLNGLPDTGNYYLHWAVSGINVVPSPATSYLLTGPTSGGFGIASSNFTVSLPPSTVLAAPVIVTPNDGGFGTPGTFSPTFVTLTTGSPTQTFTYTPATYGNKTISTTNSGPLSNPASIIFSVHAATYTMTGPGSGNTGAASTNFTVALPVGGVVTGTVTVTMHDAGDGGTFTPSTVGLTTGAPSATFTYTPLTNGTKTLSVTNDGGLTDPTNLSYVASTPFVPTDISGCQMWLEADNGPSGFREGDIVTPMLVDGDPVTLWPDRSGLANHVGQPTAGNKPIYKAGIVGGKPVVRFDGVDDFMFDSSTNIPGTGHYTIFAVVAAASTSAGEHYVYYNGVSGTSFGLGLERGAADFNSKQFTGAAYPSPTDTGGVVAGVFNVLACDWDGTNMHLWRGGTLKATVAATALGGTGTINVIGAADPGTSANWNGDIAEFLFYTGSLSSTDRDNVTNYLKAKYGL